MKNAMYAAIMASQKGGRNSKGKMKKKNFVPRKKMRKPQVEGRGFGKGKVGL